jgi:DNA-binding NtrC family response regulator
MSKLMRLGSILIVEDDDGFQELLQRCVAAAGCRWEAAFSSWEAIDKLEARTFDLVILDLYLIPAVAEPDGIRVVDWLVCNGRDTKVIVISGYLTVASTRQLFQSGIVVDCIEKGNLSLQRFDTLIRDIMSE